MTDDVRLVERLATLDWPALREELDRFGYALTPPLLDDAQSDELIGMFDAAEPFRSTIVMSRHAFGEGTYRYFAEPLPPVVQQLRSELYPPLAEVANRWAEQLGETTFPGALDDLLAGCAAAGQRKPTPLLLFYDAGGYNCLHQDVYGDVTFPLQVTIMLSRPGTDFTGGENVFVEQRPRAQSRPGVVNLERGQAVVFATRHRPVPSARGYKRVIMRHGVSTVHSGPRYTLGVIFHNAR